MSDSSSAFPNRLGRFEVGTRVGGGGMAHVYVGRGVSSDGGEELVALKVIREEHGNDTRFLRMFSDEAKILERISHPNVIRTIEYGITSKHRYIVMELLAGRTLAELWDALVEQGERVPLPLAAWICARVANGLHAAHELVDEKGVALSVVHRDVNPSNIFLTHNGEVKLIDFGLAKARIRRDSTSRGMVKGKIPYLAPEQIQQLSVDRRIDIFSLGTTLWELCTMERLFKRDNDLNTLRAIRDDEIPDARSRVEDIPASLHSIISRTLKRDRDERYQTAEELRADLDLFALSHAETSNDMSEELIKLLSRVFPGELKRHTNWRDAAIAVKIMATAAPPPMPFPMASSRGLSDVDIELNDTDIEIIDLPPKALPPKIKK